MEINKDSILIELRFFFFFFFLRRKDDDDDDDLKVSRFLLVVRHRKH